MSQSDLVNTTTPIMSLSADASEKRKRGRPRKYPSLNLEENVGIISHREITRTQPGFCQVNRGEGTSDVMLGQVVSGVVEAVFDAGYLLCFRVGNSETTLRGVVFKPGHYVPISAENDLAPNLQMIRRNEIPLPTESREVNSRSGNGTFSFNESIETNQASRNVAQGAHSVFSRDTADPVILQPSDLVKGVPVSSESTFVATSEGKQLLEASFPSKESTPIAQKVNTETDPSSQLQSHSLDDLEAKSTKFPGLPFENLVSEVIKRIHPSPLEKTQIEETNNNAAQPRVQAVQLDPPSEPVDTNRADRMAELLQVLQETMTQSEELQADVTMTDLSLEVDEQEGRNKTGAKLG